MRNCHSYYFGKCYKYRAFFDPGSVERGYLENLITKREAYFASPLEFNDPYDCRPTYTRGSDPKEDRRRIARAWEEGRVKAGHPKPSRSERSRHVTKVMAKISSPEGAAAHFHPYLQSGIGVFCMSKRWDLLPQWAYYGDVGRGVCLEYDIQEDSGFSRVYEVEYSSDRPCVEITRMLYDREYQTDALFRAVMTKARAWAKEKEVRALHSKSELLEHPHGILKAIIVGQMASAENVTWLKTILKNSGMEDMPVEQVRLNELGFKLDRLPLNFP